MQFLHSIPPYLLLAYVVFCTSLLCYFYGNLTQNVSQVDRLWSILPILLSWAYAFVSEWSEIVVLMACLVTLWGLRLTWNFYKKGGYRMIGFRFVEEDYRWNLLRGIITNPICWDLFHLFFICFFQLSLIVGFTCPILLVALSDIRHHPIDQDDVSFSLLFLIFLGIETVADRGMFQFQTKKKAHLKESDISFKTGFYCSGLYRFSRHPNYFAEVMQWFILYCWASYRLGVWVNWGLPFVVVLFVVVFSSTFLSESHSSKKYPLYKEYQKAVPRFFPVISNQYVDFVKTVQESVK